MIQLGINAHDVRWQTMPPLFDSRLYNQSRASSSQCGISRLTTLQPRFGLTPWDYWRECNLQFGDTVPHSQHLPRQNFYAEQTVVSVNDTALLIERKDPDGLVRRRSTHRSVASDHVYVVFQRQGTATIRAGDNVITRHPGQLSLAMNDVAYSGETTAAEFSLFAMPVDLAGSEADRLRKMSGQTLIGSLSPLFGNLLSRCIDERKSDDPRVWESLITSVQALFLATVAGSRVEVEPARSAMKMEREIANKDFIERNLERELDIESICSHFQISRSTVYNVLEPLGGVYNYLRHRRLEHARRLILESSSTISMKAIAYLLKFRTPEEFSRAFKRQFGTSPRELLADRNRYHRDSKAPNS